MDLFEVIVSYYDYLHNCELGYILREDQNHSLVQFREGLSCMKICIIAARCDRYN
jgi:hypothetical protein